MTRHILVCALARAVGNVLCSVLAAASFDHLVGTGKHTRRYFQAECFGSLDVEHGFVFRRSLHREVGWFLAFQDAVVSVASNCTGASDKVAITAAWRASRRPGTGQQRRARRLGLQSRAQAYVFNVFGWLAEAARG